MSSDSLPRHSTIEPEYRLDTTPVRSQASSRNVQGDVLAVLQETLEHARSGELELKEVANAGLAVVVSRGTVRLTLVVDVSDAGHTLSPRELQIARLVASGATNHTIARSLDISTWTVSTHLRRIFAKLSVCTRAEMVAQLYGTPYLLS